MLVPLQLHLWRFAHCTGVQGLQHRSTAALVRAKCVPHCSVLLWKTGLQDALCHCIYTYGDFLFIQVYEDPTPMHCSFAEGKMPSPLFNAALQNRLTSRQCGTAVTPIKMCSSYRCAVTQPQCTAALFRAKCSPHCSVLLCKTGLQQAVCHCTYIYGDVLFMQMCIDPATTHCSSVEGKMQSPLFSAALQNRSTAGSVSLQLHLWRCALHTALQ